MLNLKGQSDKKSKNIIGIIQSCLILVLVILIIFMMIQISWLQGTARVINYAGLVRGATQREVKLEITENRNEELMKYLDDILSGLRYQDGHYDLVKLQDKVCTIINITRHSISSADKSSIVRIFVAIFSE